MTPEFGVPEYTVLTVVGIVAVVVLELAWARTGIFRSWQYWSAMAIVFGFQILVDGWLTKLSDPIVTYSPAQFSGVRFPWDIPLEDFGFGFAMVTLTLVLWLRLGRSRTRSQRTQPQGTHPQGTHPQRQETE